MKSTKQIELDSSYRDRLRFPLPAEFELTVDSTGAIVTVDRNGQPLQGRSAVNPVSKQVVIFPPQNPIGSSQLQWEPLAFFLDTLEDINTIESREYLPYMFALPDATQNFLRLDELPIASTDPTTTAINPSTDLARRVIPLGRADNFYVDDYLENVSTGEMRKIIGFSYDIVPILLQTVVVTAVTVVGSNSYVELERVNDNTIPPSNVDRFYQGKTITFSNGTSKTIINYFLNNIGYPIVQLDTPLSSAITMGSTASIIAPEGWKVNIESEFSTNIPFYPAYRNPTLGTNIIYRKIGLFEGDRIFAMKSVRHVNNTIGIVFQTYTTIGYIRSIDVNGLLWNPPITIFTDNRGFVSVGNYGIDVCVINNFPAIIFAGDSGTPTLYFVRALDTFGDTWPNAATIVPVSVGGNDIKLASKSLIKIQPIPPQGISGTVLTTDAGFPEIAYTDRTDGYIAILRGDAAVPTIWTQDFMLGSPIVGAVADMDYNLQAPEGRYDNTDAGAPFADNLMTRTIITYRASAGFNVVNSTFNTDLTGNVLINEGYYATLDDIALALETALGGAFTVSVSADVFTITNAAPFIINTTTLATRMGFTATPTGSALSHIGDTTQSFQIVQEGAIGLIIRNAPNTDWIIDNSMINKIVDGFQSFANVASIIPIDTDSVNHPLVERTEPLLTIVFKDAEDNILKARKQSFTFVSSQSIYIGRFGGATDINIANPVIDGNPLATDMTFPTVYLTNTSRVVISYIQSDSIKNEVFSPDNVATKTPYIVATAENIQVFTSLVNFNNLGAFIAFQELDETLYAMVPVSNDLVIGSQYRIRRGIPETRGDSSTILDGSTTTIRLASSLTSNVDGFYNGSFIWVYNEVVNPIPEPFYMFNDYRQIVAYDGATHTATVFPAFTSNISSTLMENFFVAADRTTLGIGATFGLVDATIASGTYADLDALLLALQNALQTQDVTFTVSQLNGIVTISRATNFEVDETILSNALGFNGSLSGSNTYTGDIEANFVNSVQWEILMFTTDGFFPLIYNDTTVSTNQPVCYEIELLSLILPNITLATGNGNRIAFYPYVYVEFHNTTAAQGNFISYSNNPNAAKTLFRVPITNIVDPTRSTFVSLSARGIQTIVFKPNDTFKFRVSLPNGELFQTLATDTTPPFPPDADIQLSAIFGIRRVAPGGGCGGI